jgi:hypothetical protein
MTSASVALIVLGSSPPQPERPRPNWSGIITGVVIDAQREPVADATVQAFPVPTTAPQTGQTKCAVHHIRDRRHQRTRKGVPDCRAAARQYSGWRQDAAFIAF